MSKGDELKFERRAAAKAGTELGIPTDEMRRRNCVPEMPWTTPNGCVYDSGDYPAMLELAKEMIRWDDWSSWRLHDRVDSEPRRPPSRDDAAGRYRDDA